MIPPYPWTLPALLGQLRLIDPCKLITVSVKSPPDDAGSDGREEFREDVVVVDLEQNPTRHFFRGEEVLDVGLVVECASIAGAGWGEWC